MIFQGSSSMSYLSENNYPIVIFTETFDSVSDSVCRWLLHYKQPFLRVNYNDPHIQVSAISSNLNQGALQFENQEETLNLDKIKSVWFRRGSFYNLPISAIDNCNDDRIKNFLRNEYTTFFSFIHSELRKKCFVLGNPEKSILNKIQVLNIARNIGFIVPKSIITTDAKEVRSFFKTSYLAKAINDLLEVECDGKVYQQRIKYFHHIKDSPDDFSLSFFQEVINYVAEIRVFYLLGNCYTVVNYGIENETIWTRYNLPHSVCRKIIKLMNEIDLNTGSIDLLLTGKGDYYFLEVNPVGQFEWLNYYGNFFLEKKIAEELIKRGA